MKDAVTRPDFPILTVLDAVRGAVADYPPAVMFDLAERGFASLFQQTVACIISIRTREEVTLPASLRLFAIASEPSQVAALSESEIVAAIQPSTFAEQKAGRIRQIAAMTAALPGAALACSREALLALPGVGPKCANLALGIACGVPLVAADIHVHRVANRWGYVSTNSPEATMEALQSVVPSARRVELNRLLVPFGKHLCVGQRPWCSRCPVRSECWRVGVTASR